MLLKAENLMLNVIINALPFCLNRRLNETLGSNGFALSSENALEIGRRPRSLEIARDGT